MHLCHIDLRSNWSSRSNDKAFIEILAADPWVSKKKVTVSHHCVRVQYRHFNPDLVFKIIELEGIRPQALECTQRVCDFPLGPAGTVKNSKVNAVLLSPPQVLISTEEFCSELISSDQSLYNWDGSALISIRIADQH